MSTCLGGGFMRMIFSSRGPEPLAPAIFGHLHVAGERNVGESELPLTPRRLSP
jgi:hypothetical protein